MNKETRAALKNSILKYQKYVKVLKENIGKITNYGTLKIFLGSNNCDLCKLFLYDSCKNCPIFKRTNFTNCRNTPYDKIPKFDGTNLVLNSEIVSAFLNEVDFLESLLSEKEVNSKLIIKNYNCETVCSVNNPSISLYKNLNYLTIIGFDETFKYKVLKTDYYNETKTIEIIIDTHKENIFK